MTAVLTPEQIVAELDKHIIGQQEAKRAVAIALRNRWRRMQIAEPLREEITPKNILMIGPTGVGKTEIARRLARLANAPFIKVEATKFTEVGYVGRDVESIIRDLVDIAIKQAREEEIKNVAAKAQATAEEKILDALLPSGSKLTIDENEQPESSTRELFRRKLHAGDLDDKEIEIDISVAAVGVEIMAPPGMEEMTSQLQSIFQNMGGEKIKTRKMKVKEAFKLLREEEEDRLIDKNSLKLRAIKEAEQNAIVFIDEIDKVAKRSEYSGADVSREGVQRDLLPLVEGTTVATKYGMIKTDHILFIASGAFHMSKPSDLIAELQGRLPIRVELTALSVDDFIRILTEPTASLTEQYQALLATEGVHLEFTPEGVRRIAEVAWHVNERTENIGARRLYTVMERLVEELSFLAPNQAGTTVIVDKSFVENKLASIALDEELSKFIL